MHQFNSIYTELYPIYAAKFERRNLDFDKHFGHAYSNEAYRATDKNLQQQIATALEAVLAIYTASQPKTKGGNVLRKIGRILGYLMPFFRRFKIGGK